MIHCSTVNLYFEVMREKDMRLIRMCDWKVLLNEDDPFFKDLFKVPI